MLPTEVRLTCLQTILNSRRCSEPSLAVDKKLPWGMIGTLEGLYTKTINNVTYFNLNRDPSADFYLTGADNRPRYNG